MRSNLYPSKSKLKRQKCHKFDTQTNPKCCFRTSKRLQAHWHLVGRTWAAWGSKHPECVFFHPACKAGTPRGRLNFQTGHTHTLRVSLCARMCGCASWGLLEFNLIFKLPQNLFKGTSWSQPRMAQGLQNAPTWNPNGILEGIEKCPGLHLG